MMPVEVFRGEVGVASDTNGMKFFLLTVVASDTSDDFLSEEQSQ